MISMASSPFALRFRTYHMLVLLGAVPVTNKVYRKLANYQSGLSSFNVAINIRNDRSLNANLLPLL